MWYKCSTGNCSLGGTNNLNRHNISNDSSNFGTQLNNSNYGSYTGATNSWHTYGAKIDDNKITYYFDNVPILDWEGITLRKYVAGSAPNCTTNPNKCESTSPPTNGIETLLSLDRAIILNLAVGGKFPTYDEPDGSGLGYGYTGNEDGVGGYNNGNLGATLPGDMEIDYVRVYKLQDAPEQPTETSNEGSGISSGSSSGSSSTYSSSGNSSASNSSSSNKESDDTDSIDGETEEKSESVAASQNGSGSSDDIAGNVATDLNKLSVNKPNPIMIIFSSVAAISAITLSGLIIFKPSFRIAAHKIFSHFVLHH